MVAITFLKVIVKVEKFSQSRYNENTRCFVKTNKSMCSFKLYYIYIYVLYTHTHTHITETFKCLCARE